MTNEEISQLKPSALIRLAVHDLELQENAPNSRVDMYTWLRTDKTGCAACLAGSVMRHSLGLTNAGPERIQDWVAALNGLGMGSVGYFIWRSQLEGSGLYVDYDDDQVNYHENPEAFKLWCLLIAEILEEDNL